MSRAIGKVLGASQSMITDNLQNPSNDPNKNLIIQALEKYIAENNAKSLDKNTLQNLQYQTHPNYISDDELYKKMWNNIEQFEKVVPHPYLDTKGYITVGAGANINNFDDFMKVNFTVNGVPATDEQKMEAYKHLLEASEERDWLGNYINHNKGANTFENDTNLRLSNQDAYNMAQSHMINDLAHVRNEFTDFDVFPNPLKEVLLDIQYNTGKLNKQNWPELYNAIDNHDVNGILNNVHRKNVGWDRNDWAEKMARSIKF